MSLIEGPGSETRKERPEDTEPGDDDSRPVDLRLERGSRCVGRVKQPQCCPDDRKQAAKCGDKRPASIAVGRRQTRFAHDEKAKRSGQHHDRSEHCAVCSKEAADFTRLQQERRDRSQDRKGCKHHEDPEPTATLGGQTTERCVGGDCKIGAAREAPDLAAPFGPGEEQRRHECNHRTDCADQCATGLGGGDESETAGLVGLGARLGRLFLLGEQELWVASIGERSVESSEQVHAIGCLGLANAVQNNSHGEQGKAS